MGLCERMPQRPFPLVVALLILLSSIKLEKRKIENADKQSILGEPGFVYSR
jgi:hypothetical protein